jgi:C4-type Zn-finger protein
VSDGRDVVDSDLEGGVDMISKFKSVSCPSCGDCDLDLMDYDSLMVLKPDLGLFTITCPNCKTKVSSIQVIPEELRPKVLMVAEEVDAGMGR